MGKYKVTIHFKEPAFFEHIGQDKDTVKNIDFTVAADDPEQAEETGNHEFESLKKKSLVHWERIIVSIDVEAIEN